MKQEQQTGQRMVSKSRRTFNFRKGVKPFVVGLVLLFLCLAGLFATLLLPFDFLRSQRWTDNFPMIWCFTLLNGFACIERSQINEPPRAEQPGSRLTRADAGAGGRVATRHRNGE